TDVGPPGPADAVIGGATARGTGLEAETGRWRIDTGPGAMSGRCPTVGSIVISRVQSSCPGSYIPIPYNSAATVVRSLKNRHDRDMAVIMRKIGLEVARLLRNRISS